MLEASRGRMATHDGWLSDMEEMRTRSGDYPTWAEPM
jgi:hypothetical protein